MRRLASAIVVQEIVFQSTCITYSAFAPRVRYNLPVLLDGETAGAYRYEDSDIRQHYHSAHVSDVRLHP